MIQALLAGASIVGGLMGASSQKKAAKEAAAAQDRATAANERIAREQMALAQQYNAPYANAGVPALNALQSRVLPTAQAYGVGAPSKQGNAGGFFPEGQPPMQSGPDWNAYINAPENRDILDHYNQLAPQDKARYPTPASFGEAHWTGIGSTEGRAVSPFQAQPQAQPQAAQDPASMYGVPADMNQSFGPRPQGDPRPTQQAFEFGQPKPQFNFNESTFKADPGYQFRLNETMRGVTANQFAGGLGLSGSRLKALQDRAGGLADQTYNDAFGRAYSLYQTDLGQFNQDRSFARQSYDTDANRSDSRFDIDTSRADARYDTDRNFYNQDRGFAAGRFDRQTGDIFGLAGVGQQGAAAITGAGQNMSNALMQGNQQSADTRGNAAIARANSTNGALQNALMTAGMFASSYGGGGGGSSGGGSSLQNWGSFGGYGYGAAPTTSYRL